MNVTKKTKVNCNEHEKRKKIEKTLAKIYKIIYIVVIDSKKLI